MDTKKIIKRSIAGLVYLAVIVLAVLAVSNHLHLKKLSQGVNPGTPAKNESAVPSVSENDESTQRGTVQDTTINAVENKSVTDKAEVLKARLEATEKELDMTYNRISDEQARKDEALKKATEAAQKTFEDPATMKMIRDGMIKRLGSENSKYAPLFYKLNLSPEDLEKLKELIIDGEIASGEIKAFDGMISFLTSNEIGDEYMMKIEELLGDGDNAIFLAYRERLGGAQGVSNFNKWLSSNDSLTMDQQLELIDAWYETESNIHSEQVQEESINRKLPSEMNEEEKAKRIERLEKEDEAYIEASRDILSESQMEQLKAYLKEMHDGITLYEGDGAFSSVSKS